MEARLLEQANPLAQPLPFTTVSGGAVVGVGAQRSLLGLAQLVRGSWQALGLLRHFKPDVLFVTGGYSAIAVAFACWLRRVPVLVYLPDVEPGAAVRLVARFARLVCVTDPDSQPFFKKKTVQVTGYPLRAEVLAARSVSVAQARQQLGLLPDRRTLLVFGGSRGARSLNQATLTNLPALCQTLDLQVLHLTGTLDWEQVATQAASLPSDLQNLYHPKPYLHQEMGLAFRAADVVVARAGASTLGELPAFGLPALLVPYPHAWHYQRVNAEALVRHGAAQLVTDADLSQQLIPTLGAVLQPTTYAQMQAAAQSLARPTAAATLAQALLSLGGTS
jgi:UDP-N-acetylglucosamine--N-acetylmuramyl-(pentapeptide) pyrophosphoryl-undecaprenol N-acetylglucosamine transferase